MLSKNHGYNFEVPATSQIKLTRAIPIKSMGRFMHEAVAVDDINNFISSIEDIDESIWRNEFGSHSICSKFSDSGY